MPRVLIALWRILLSFINVPVLCFAVLNWVLFDNYRGNNALHIAVKEGHMEVIRVLLTESQIDAEATNFKGRNQLHILANFANENAVAIFDLFLECMPNYPLDKMDSDGNTGK